MPADAAQRFRNAAEKTEYHGVEPAILRQMKYIALAHIDIPHPRQSNVFAQHGQRIFGNVHCGHSGAVWGKRQRKIAEPTARVQKVRIGGQMRRDAGREGVVKGRILRRIL